MSKLLASPVDQFLCNDIDSEIDDFRPVRDSVAAVQVLASIRAMRAKENIEVTLDSTFPDATQSDYMAELSAWLSGIQGRMGSRGLSAYMNARATVRDAVADAGGTPYALPIVVDLACPDQLLVDAFKTWLAEVRDQFGPAPKLIHWSPASIQGWADCRVLQYLDIKVFCLSNRGFVTNTLLGDTLFPEGAEVDLVEKCRKVVLPCAERLMNESFLSALGHAVAHPEGI